VPINRDSILGRVALDRRTIHSPDVLADPEFKRPDWQAVGKQRTVLGVPLLGDGTLLGVIILARTETRPFTEKQIDLVTTFADQAVIAVNNVGLFEEVQARTRELQEALEYQTAASDVLNVISRAPSQLHPVFDAIVETAARLCQAEYALVHMLRDGEYHMTAANNAAADYVKYVRDHPLAPERGSVVGRTALDGRTLHVPDCLADPEYTALGHQRAGGFRTMLGVPLVRTGKTIGVILLMRNVVKPFAAKQIELVSTFADQAVIAINNVGLFEEVQARTAELQQSLEYQTATSDVLSVISRSPSQIQPVLETIVETAAQLCDAKRAFIYRYDGALLRYQASHNASPELMDFVTRNPISPGRHSGVARAALERRTTHISDVRSDPEYTFGGANVDPIRTVLAVPMLKASDLVGVLVIYRLEVRPFTEKQIELVTTFADQAVIAIENVRLFEEVKARTREVTESLEYQTATSDVLNIISRSPNQLQPVLEAIVETAGRLCEAYDANLWLKVGNGLKNAAHRGPIPVDFDEWPITREWTAGRAFIDRRSVHVHNLAEAGDEFPEGQAMAVRLGHRTILSTPLMRKDEAIGVLAVRRKEVRPFSEKQTAVLQTFADQAVIAIENVRLFEEVQARTAELQKALEYQTATSDVLSVISRSPNNLEPVLDAIVDTASRLCDAYDATLVLRDGESLRPAAHRGPILLDWERLPISRDWVTGRAVADRLPVHVHDLQSAATDFASGHEMALRSGLRAVLAMPLLRENAAIGAILLRRTEARPFSQEQITLLQTFADQAVIAINNVRLFEEVQARTRELQESLEYQTATSDVLNVISRSPSNIQPVLDAIAETAQRLCESEHAFIMRLEGGLYCLAASRSLSTVQVDHLIHNPVPADHGSVVGRVALERRTIQVEDVLADREYTAGRPGFRTILGVPLLREEAVIGVIVLTRSDVQPFGRKQIELLETFADQGVIAIENVRLFDEVQARTRELARSVEELRALGEVSHAVNSTLEIETVLSTIVEKAVQLSATDAGAIYVFSNQRQKFRLRATFGMSEAMIAEIGNLSIGLGESYIGAAAKNGEAVQVPDLAIEPSSPMRDLVVRAGYRGLLVLPLLRPGRIVGALVVRRKEPGSFLRSTIDLLQTFAAQSVLAIQNARLFADVDARTRELGKSLNELRAAQERLVQTEKLASLGQLTAGIAHEIKNPLNFVNNFAALSIELVDELKAAIASPQSSDPQDGAELMELLSGNLEKILQHGKRADSIVKNMLLHSRTGAGERRAADINALVEESLNLAYHGARAEKPGFNIMIERSFDPSAGEIHLLPQEITRVFLNLISNGFYATAKRKEGAESGYEPTLLATTRKLAEAVEIRIRDNGTGMPPEVKEKMFNPFFTTKPAGEGTGLGLSLSHDIVVKQHGGSIEVDTSPGEYTEFRIVLPRSMVSGANDKVRQ
jgi:GAF domain-containing protein